MPMDLRADTWVVMHVAVPLVVRDTIERHTDNPQALARALTSALIDLGARLKYPPFAPDEAATLRSFASAPATDDAEVERLRAEQREAYKEVDRLRELERSLRARIAELERAVLDEHTRLSQELQPEHYAPGRTAADHEADMQAVSEARRDLAALRKSAQAASDRYWDERMHELERAESREDTHEQGYREGRALEAERERTPCRRCGRMVRAGCPVHTCETIVPAADSPPPAAEPARCCELGPERHTLDCIIAQSTHP